jgi:hypothetical protein
MLKKVKTAHLGRWDARGLDELTDDVQNKVGAVIRRTYQCNLLRQQSVLIFPQEPVISFKF